LRQIFAILRTGGQIYGPISPEWGEIGGQIFTADYLVQVDIESVKKPPYLLQYVGKGAPQTSKKRKSPILWGLWGAKFTVVWTPG